MSDQLLLDAGFSQEEVDRPYNQEGIVNLSLRRQQSIDQTIAALCEHYTTHPKFKGNSTPLGVALCLFSLYCPKHDQPDFNEPHPCLFCR